MVRLYFAALRLLAVALHFRFAGLFFVLTFYRSGEWLTWTRGNS